MYCDAVGELLLREKSPPDGQEQQLGTAKLDEPTLNPSNPSILDLQLRQLTKVDVADERVTVEVLRHEPHAVLVSARSGVGIGELLAAIDADLPRTLVDVDVVVPYERGDLLARVYREGDVVSVDHEEHGSHLKARVAEDLARELDSVAAG